MPRYTFARPEGDEITVTCSMTELDKLTEEMKKDGYERILVAPALVSQAGSTLSKTDNGWKDVLRRAKSNSGRRNTINV